MTTRAEQEARAMADALRAVDRRRRQRDEVRERFERDDAKANRKLGALIGAAREAGAPMAAIAEAMGLTRDGLYQFWRRNGL